MQNLFPLGVDLAMDIRVDQSGENFPKSILTISNAVKVKDFEVVLNLFHFEKFWF